jgi:hypothetical protein
MMQVKQKSPRKTRYFDRFFSQAQILKADLPQEFFDEWFTKLTNNFKDFRSNVYVTESSCIHHLLTHKDCPMRYRLLFIKSPFHVARAAAMLGNELNGSYIKYEFISEALGDKAKSISNKFLHAFIYYFRHKRLPPKESLKPILDFISPRIVYFRQDNLTDGMHPTLTFYEKVFIEALRRSIKEGIIGLLSPDLIVREVSAWIIKNHLQDDVTKFIEWEESLPGRKYALGQDSLEKLLII